MDEDKQDKEKKNDSSVDKLLSRAQKDGGDDSSDQDAFKETVGGGVNHQAGSDGKLSWERGIFGSLSPGARLGLLLAIPVSSIFILGFIFVVFMGSLDEKNNIIASKDKEIGKLEDEVSSLRSELKVALSEKEQYIQKRNALSFKESYLQEQGAILKRKEYKLNKATAIQKRNTITDGIWKVGSDFDAGTYRSPGGSSCYWALLGSADTGNILNNGGFTANQTLTITSPWFQTSNCGKWVKIG